MITNADVTIYNKVYDRESGSNKYYRTVLYGVNWQDLTAIQPAAQKADTGIVAADVANIYIPFQVDTEKQYRKPKNFLFEEEKADIFTIAPGDIVVKGVIDNIIDEQKEAERLKDSVDDYRVVVSVDTCDYGSPSMQHWEVVAK